MRLNLFNQTTKKYVSINPDTLHRLPGETGEVMCFEAYDASLKDASQDALTLTDFKVTAYKGHIIGVRTTMREPRGIYLSVKALFRDIFSQFEDAVIFPQELKPHPLIHRIPEGFPGAGAIVVLHKTQLRHGDQDLRGLTMVELQSRERASARQTLIDLGFTFKEQT